MRLRHSREEYDSSLLWGAFCKGGMRVKFGYARKFAREHFSFDWNWQCTLNQKCTITFFSHSLQFTHYVVKFRLGARMLRIYMKANNLGHNKLKERCCQSWGSSVEQRTRFNPSPHLIGSLRLGKPCSPNERQDLDNSLFRQDWRFQPCCVRHLVVWVKLNYGNYRIIVLFQIQLQLHIHFIWKMVDIV